jgi:hypothetical protein
MEKLKDNVSDKMTDNTVEPVSESGGLQITEFAKKTLLGMRPWIGFISVLYYVGMGVLVIQALATLFLEEGIVKIFTVCISLIGAALLFMFGTDLHLFSKSVKAAFANNDTAEMEKAFINMKSYWKLLGISTILLFFLPIVLFILG